jgi:hypothetical protein
MKKISSTVLVLLTFSKIASAATVQDAIDRLWSIQDPTDPAAEQFRDQPRKKSTLGDWVKFHQGEPFKFRVVNNVPPIDGYNFVVTMISCSTELLQPTGFPAGKEEETYGFKPPVYYNQVAVWEQKKRGCTNAFACSYEVAIEGIDDPSAKRTFGPVVAIGSKTAPDYDCFLDATDIVSVD